LRCGGIWLTAAHENFIKDTKKGIKINRINLRLINIFFKFLFIMSKKIEFRVTGTTCGSCEILLERAFRKISGVRSVKVSNRHGRVSFSVDDDVNLTTEDLSRAGDNSKYHFYPVDEGEIAAQRVSWERIVVSLTAALSVYFIFIRSGLITTGVSLNDSAGLLAIFVVGLIAAFSSCSAVVSGLVTAVAASVAAAERQLSFLQRIRPHLWFNFGRVIGFGVFGALVGLLGKMLGLSSWVNSIFLLIVAGLMVVVGLNLLGAFPGGSLFGFSRLLVAVMDKKSGTGRSATIFGLGALTFFLPCGFTQSIQLFAAASGSMWQGAIIMMVFALGTVPALLGLGLVATTARGRMLQVVSAVVGIFVIAVGYANLVSATNLLNTHVTDKGTTIKNVEVRMKNGEQIIQMEVTSNLKYAPDILYVRAGVPVRWEIYGASRMGCASSLVLREFGVSAFLKPGFNTVKFTPNRPGTYRFTCSMGMTQGTIVVLGTEK
jgi:sulfite exporter TauE/SafE/copper chaperone CopZ